jgi:hypothetical protein
MTFTLKFLAAYTYLALALAITFAYSKPLHLLYLLKVPFPGYFNLFPGKLLSRVITLLLYFPAKFSRKFTLSLYFSANDRILNEILSFST